MFGGEFLDWRWGGDAPFQFAQFGPTTVQSHVGEFSSFFGRQVQLVRVGELRLRRVKRLRHAPPFGQQANAPRIGKLEVDDVVGAVQVDFAPGGADVALHLFALQVVNHNVLEQRAIDFAEYRQCGPGKS